jgi:hypothetical protein
LISTDDLEPYATSFCSSNSQLLPPLLHAWDAGILHRIFCIVLFLPQSDQSKMITIVANGFAEVERQADEPGFVLSCRMVTMPATSTPVEDPLGGFSRGLSRNAV